MEKINDLIQHFLSMPTYKSSGDSYGCDYGSGDGSGNGYGYGDSSGDGYGSGGGDGSGDSYGCGYCSGDGYDSGDGDGYGDGSGNGYGSSDGSGNGYGSSDGGLISFCGQNIYYIDGIFTAIEKIKGNLAKGFIINDDLTTEICYIAKSENLFAHGKTFQEAAKALQDKIFDNMDIDEKIDRFLDEFKFNVKYPAMKFYEWHHFLTGSCEFGRNAFVKNHGIDLGNDTYTVEEFIEITKHDYGGEIIEKLEERIGG